MAITRPMTDVFNGPATAGAILSPSLDLGTGDGTPAAMGTTFSTDSIFGGDTSSTSSYCGFRFATGGIDLSTRSYVAWQMAHNGLSNFAVDTFANAGMRVAFDDGTNWAAYVVYGGDVTPFFSAAEGAFGGFAGFASNDQSLTASWFLDRDNRTPYASSGTLNWSNVTHIEVHFKPASTGRMMVAMGRIATADAPIFTGTVTTSIWKDIRNFYANPSNGYPYPWVSRPAALYALSSSQVLQTLQIGVQIGDGSTTTTVSDSNLSISLWGPADDYSTSTETPPNTVLLVDTPRPVTINTSASDSITLSDFLLSSTGQVGFRVIGNTSGTASFPRATFNPFNLMELGHGSYSDTIWDNGDVPVEITSNTAITGSSIVRNSAGIEITSGAGDYSALSITLSNNSSYDIQAGAGGAGTYDLTGISVASGYTLKLRNNSATNAVTFEIPNVTYSTSTAGGSITVNTPVDTFTINSSESSSLIQIFATGTQTLLDSTTGSSLAFQHSGQTVDYVVQKAGFLPQRFTGVALSGTTSVTVNMVIAREYDASHGLTYTTDASWSRLNNQLTVPSFGPTVQGVFSLMIDSFISETALRNTAFNIEMDGVNSMYLVNDAEGATTASITNMTRGGVGYINSSGTEVATFSGFLSVGEMTGFTAEYQQVAGSGTTNARASNDVDEIIQVYGDVTHGNFDYRGHMVFKAQPNGYFEERADIVSQFGISSLAPTLYVFSLNPQAISGFTTGDPGISVTLVDHTAAPITVGGVSFSWELQDNGTSSAISLQRDLNFYKSGDATSTDYLSLDPFNLADWIQGSPTGGTFTTVRQLIEGESGFQGLYVSRSAADHPDIASFMGDNGSIYTPATVANISVPNVTAGRIQISNQTAKGLSAWAATTAYTQGQRVLRTTGVGTELGDGVFFVCTTAGTTGGTEPTWDVAAAGNTTSDGTAVWTVYPVEFDNTTTVSGYSNSWTDGTYFTSGDTIRMRWVDEDDQEISAENTATVDGTTTFLNTPSTDTVYTSYGIDGSTVDATGEYAADFPNVQVDVNDPDNVFYLDRFYAWWKYNLTTADGIRNFFGGLTATDTSNLRIINSVVDILFDNVKAVSARQGDTIVIQREDGAYPQVTTTSGGGGLGFYYAGIGYSTSSGSGLDTTERNKLLGLRDFDPDTDIVEGSFTHTQATRLILAEAAGKVGVSGTTVTFRDQADTKDRITATTDANGQRTAITVDAT